jgi:hypothetical protein
MPAAAARDVESLEPLSDEELTAVALAADPDPSLDADAVSFWELTGAGPDQRLPEWYMPTPVGGRPVRGWRRRLVILLIASFLLIDAYGLCNIYGWVSFG